MTLLLLGWCRDMPDLPIHGQMITETNYLSEVVEVTRTMGKWVRLHGLGSVIYLKRSVFHISELINH